jgi:hypothetical protein
MKINKLLFLNFILACSWILLSSWGSTGHYKINHHAPASFPTPMAFLTPSWTTLLADHASDADDRKSSDPTESPKHYINIDNYPEFVTTGRIPQTYDSLVAIHGYAFVLDAGILPFAILNTVAALKTSFMQKDWAKCVQNAADLGHYVGDGHQPLHLTKNYDGQYTNQSGIHSRYESHMVGTYNNQIVYPDDSATYVTDLTPFVFNFIYLDYKYKDSLLLADTYAKGVAGNTNSSAYYAALWEKAGPFTIMLFHNASHFLADLIYTAWVDAGSPMIYPTGINELQAVRMEPNFPNPFSGTTAIPFEVMDSHADLTLSLCDDHGNLVTTLVSGSCDKGLHQVIWDASGYPSGVYYLVSKSGGKSSVSKLIHIR